MSSLELRMINGFLIGLGFALAEHAVKAFAENVSKFSAPKLITNLMYESPSFVAFAFIAGVGADWLTDTKSNHAAAILASSGIWLFSLWLRHILMHNGFHLEPIFLKQSFRRWGLHVFAVCSIAWMLSLVPYFYWEDLIGVSHLLLVWAVVFFSAAYASLVLIYLCHLNDWEIAKCSLFVRERIVMYCKRQPEHYIRAASDPKVVATQEYWFLDAKWKSAKVQYDASIECCCLEDNLVEAIRPDVRLRDPEIRAAVRRLIKDIGLEIELDFQALNLLVGDEKQFRKAKDILTKSKYQANIPALEEIRNRLLGGRED